MIEQPKYVFDYINPNSLIARLNEIKDKSEGDIFLGCPLDRTPKHRGIVNILNDSKTSARLIYPVKQEVENHGVWEFVSAVVGLGIFSEIKIGSIIIEQNLIDLASCYGGVQESLWFKLNKDILLGNGMMLSAGKINFSVTAGDYMFEKERQDSVKTIIPFHYAKHSLSDIIPDKFIAA